MNTHLTQHAMRRNEKVVATRLAEPILVTNSHVLKVPFARLFHFPLDRTMGVSRLVLDAVQLQNRQLEVLVKSLAHNKTVIELSLAQNHLTATSIRCLSTLPSTSSLTSINLDENALGKSGILLVARLLEKNMKILYVSMGGNRIDDEGVESFVQSFISIQLSRKHRDRQFPVLRLQNNWISRRGLKWLLKLCAINCSITTLDVSGNINISDTSVAMLSNFVQSNTSLKHLDVSNCAISAAWTQELIRSLRLSDTLIILGVGSSTPASPHQTAEKIEVKFWTNKKSKFSVNSCNLHRHTAKLNFL